MLLLLPGGEGRDEGDLVGQTVVGVSAPHPGPLPGGEGEEFSLQTFLVNIYDIL